MGFSSTRFLTASIFSSIILVRGSFAAGFSKYTTSYGGVFTVSSLILKAAASVPTGRGCGEYVDHTASILPPRRCTCGGHSGYHYFRRSDAHRVDMATTTSAAVLSTSDSRGSLIGHNPATHTAAGQRCGRYGNIGQQIHGNLKGQKLQEREK